MTDNEYNFAIAAIIIIFLFSCGGWTIWGCWCGTYQKVKNPSYHSLDLTPDPPPVPELASTHPPNDFIV